MDEITDKLTSRIIETVNHIYDRQVIAFLKKNGVKVDPRNVQATVKELDNKGYKLVTERREKGPIGDSKVIYTFYLCKIIDKSEFVMNFHLKIGDDE